MGETQKQYPVEKFVQKQSHVLWPDKKHLNMHL